MASEVIFHSRLKQKHVINRRFFGHANRQWSRKLLLEKFGNFRRFKSMCIKWIGIYRVFTTFRFTICTYAENVCLWHVLYFVSLAFCICLKIVHIYASAFWWTYLSSVLQKSREEQRTALFALSDFIFWSQYQTSNIGLDRYESMLFVFSTRVICTGACQHGRQRKCK